MFDRQETAIHGAWLLHPPVHDDRRGRFVKTFHAPTFATLGLSAHFPETYYSVSARRVLRGLHFQRPPHDHDKLVHCVSGAVLDVLLDLRASSPTHGQYAVLSLCGEIPSLLYLPRGVAHGFYVTSEEAVMLYHVTAVYQPDMDAGVRWNSAGIPWPDDAPIVSARDRTLPSMAQLDQLFP